MVAIAALVAASVGAALLFYTPSTSAPRSASPVAASKAAPIGLEVESEDGPSSSRVEKGFQEPSDAGAQAQDPSSVPVAPDGDLDWKSLYEAMTTGDLMAEHKRLSKEFSESSNAELARLHELGAHEFLREGNSAQGSDFLENEIISIVISKDGVYRAVLDRAQFSSLYDLEEKVEFLSGEIASRD